MECVCVCSEGMKSPQVARKQFPPPPPLLHPSPVGRPTGDAQQQQQQQTRAWDQLGRVSTEKERDRFARIIDLSRAHRADRPLRVRYARAAAAGRPCYRVSSWYRVAAAAAASSSWRARSFRSPARIGPLPTAHPLIDRRRNVQTKWCAPHGRVSAGNLPSTATAVTGE